MASQWFYQIDGEKVGPATSPQLRQLVDEGQIQTTTLVWREGIADWIEAQRVKGLFTDTGDSGVALSGILKPTLPENFDPYHKWLGIPPEEQPPHYYRLLGIKLFESGRGSGRNRSAPDRLVRGNEKRQRLVDPPQFRSSQTR